MSGYGKRIKEIDLLTNECLDWLSVNESFNPVTVAGLKRSYLPVQHC